MNVRYLQSTNGRIYEVESDNARGFTRFRVKDVMSKKVSVIFDLMNEQPEGSELDLKTKEIVKRTEVFKLKDRPQIMNKIVKERRTIAFKNNIINIRED